MNSDIVIALGSIGGLVVVFCLFVFFCILIDQIPTKKTEEQDEDGDKTKGAVVFAEDKDLLDRNDAFVLACLVSDQSGEALQFACRHLVRPEVGETLIKCFVGQGDIKYAQKAASLVSRKLTEDELKAMILKQSWPNVYDLAVQYGLKDLRNEIIRETHPLNVIQSAKSRSSICKDEIERAFREYLGINFQRACEDLIEYGPVLIGDEWTREIARYATSFALTYSPRFAKDILGGIGKLGCNELLEKSSACDQLARSFLDETSCFAEMMKDFRDDSRGVISAFYCVRYASSETKAKAVKFFIDHHAPHLAEKLL